MVKVKVKLSGWLKRLSPREEILVELGEKPTVREVFDKLVAELGPEFESSVVDEELRDPRARVLVMVNGVEISALSGLETLVDEGSEVVLIPFFHGG